ncbi:hypothetical protein SRHO_G00310600 [Serrasalmus rhombeus]
MNFLKDSLLRFGRMTRSSPLHATVPVTFILMGAEKMMGLEFSCPCQPQLNLSLVSFMFSVPALLVFTIMLILARPCKYTCGCCSCRKFAESFLACLIPPTVWFILLFLDGRYLACVMTNWNGMYVSDMGDPPVRWCEPVGSNKIKGRRLHQDFITYSKIMGYFLLFGICLVIVCAVCCWDCCHPKEQDVEKVSDGETRQQ